MWIWGIMGRGVTLILGKRKTLRHTSRPLAQAYHDLARPFKNESHQYMNLLKRVKKYVYLHLTSVPSDAATNIAICVRQLFQFKSERMIGREGST